MRSLLIVSTDSDAGWEGAIASRADAVAIDLADVPADARPAAREKTVRWLAGPRAGLVRLVRIGSLSSGCADTDLDAVVPSRPDAIWLPDATGGRDVQHLAAKLAVREAEYGLDDGSVTILATPIATASGLFSLGTLAGASARLIGLVFDPDRLAARVGSAGCRDEGGLLTEPYRLARTLTLFAAASAGVPALDCACPAEAPSGLARECSEARRDGFAGKLARQLAEIATINGLFSESPTG